MSFITTPLVVGIIFVTIYRLFRLFVCRKERIMVLEKMLQNPGITPPPYPGASPMADFKMPSIDTGTDLFGRFSALKWGCLIAGLGLGLLIGSITCCVIFPLKSIEHTWQINDGMPGLLLGSSVLLFGGIGLVLSYVIDNRRHRD